MIEIDFGDKGGGRRTFKTIGDVQEYVQEQLAAWTEDAVFDAMAKNNRPPPGGDLRAFIDRWSGLRNQIVSLQGQMGSNEGQIVTSFQQSVRTSQAVARSSLEGAAISEIAAQSGAMACYGAIRFISGQPDERLLDNMPKAQFIGALDMWARINRLDSQAAAKARDSARKLLAEVQERETAHRAELQRIEEGLRQQIAGFQAALEQAGSEFAQFKGQASSEIADDRVRWQGEWEDKLKLYTEQLKLRAAVSQWGERAEAHEQAFRSQRLWSIGIGTLGLVGAVLWGWGALAFAKWLFSGALGTGAHSVPTGVLRPTWSHELVFAASASVLYLTLFLWSMRILVRMMMSEHHLGIDARSRESMAHTYLALLEDGGAATEADRAIVLAALFRPVTDGLVKDDALPMISPATILSGKLAGA